ncbi:MAG: carboxymuconolactone decarboxylase family protein [Acidobacteria bacterium]|nr:carboxymuconolactone decarboxylase family protein [Acidobacteriota bacterium]
MSRFEAIDGAAATGRDKYLLDTVKLKMGRVPNITRLMANSPAALEGYLKFSGALATGKLDPRLRERIAINVAKVNECNYCLSAHTAIGQ